MRIAAVDFSGAADASTQRRKIWIAEFEPGASIRARSGMTRAELLDYLVAGRKDLACVGLDFAFVYPAWFMQRNGLVGDESSPDAVAGMWDVVAEEGERWLANCSWPFWGRPGTRRTLPHMKAYTVREQRQRAAGLPVKSVFQIGGAGAVGSASIRGIPLLPRLRAAGFSVWPVDIPALPLVLEVYPRAFTPGVVKSEAAAREAYLDRLQLPVEAASRSAAVAGDDAFDAVAAVAALSAACRCHAADDGARVPRAQRSPSEAAAASSVRTSSSPVSR